MASIIRFHSFIDIESMRRPSNLLSLSSIGNDMAYQPRLIKIWTSLLTIFNFGLHFSGLEFCHQCRITLPQPLLMYSAVASSGSVLRRVPGKFSTNFSHEFLASANLLAVVFILFGYYGSIINVPYTVLSLND